MARQINICAIVIGSLLFCGAHAFAQEQAPKETPPKDVGVERGVYTYEEKGRRDPFVTLIKIKDILPLTGDPLRDNDISQMRAIAIAWDAEGRYALFGLPDGKYYTIREGRMVGLHGGKVERILDDAILIKEMKPNFKGDLKPVETYLKLRKEEGQ